MSDKPYFEERPAVQLRTWVLGQMMRGAGYAALVLIGILVLIYAIHGLGLLLPEESKQAPDPTPEAYLAVPASTRSA